MVVTADSTSDTPILELLGLEAGDTPTTFRLPVGRDLCTPFEFLYGGTGIAASIEASERATDRPLQWITTQFLGAPKPGDVVDLDVNVSVTGRSTSQTQVAGRVDGTVVFTSLCAHNVRPDGDERAFKTMPDVERPEDCAEFAEIFEMSAPNSIFGHFDRRIAAGAFANDAVDDPQTGLLALWCRLVSTPTGSATTQGFVADLGPLAVCATMGVPPGGTSLDNTIRVVDPSPSDWVLIEVEADGFHRSVGHSTARLWSEDGRLLGIATQSAIIRRSHHHSTP